MKKLYVKVKDFVEDIWYHAEAMYMKVSGFISKWWTVLTVKERRKAMMAVVDGYPWDYSYLLSTELACIKYMREYFKNHHIVESAHDHYEKLNWAAKILERLVDEDFLEIVKTDEEGFAGLPRVEVKCKHYVNLRNMDRFIDGVSYERSYMDQDIHKNYADQTRNLYKNYPQELYREKLWNLYCLIRRRYTRTWWD